MRDATLAGWTRMTRASLFAFALGVVLAVVDHSPAETRAQVASPGLARAAGAPPWQKGEQDGTIATRFTPPLGYERPAASPASFAAWLRALPVRPGRPDVLLYDGRRKANQRAHVAVLAVEVGATDLQQCADAVMRLRAEYLRDSGRADEVCFHFTSGDAAPYREWRQGFRPHVGQRVTWAKDAGPDSSYTTFRSYLDTVFTYAGTASLIRELTKMAKNDIAVGDVLIQGGHPGHAVLVVDLAENTRGERVVLFAQSYMPAQDIQVLAASDAALSPWYRVAGERVETPEWLFSWGDLRRFAADACR